MDPVLQRYYEDVLALFNHPGWKELATDLTALRTEYDSVRNCTNLDLAKGRVDMLDHILGSPERFARAYEKVQADDAAAAMSLE